MIATAFLTNDMEKILDAGAAALDPKSVMSQIMSDVRRWHKENPRDWRATRKLTKDKYCKYGGQDMRDRNGVWLNGASTISALLYGDGDWAQTVRSAFNFGWDADNNAAASGTILGVIKGNKVAAEPGLGYQGPVPEHQPGRHAGGRDHHHLQRPAGRAGAAQHLRARRIPDDGQRKSGVPHPVPRSPPTWNALPDLKKQYAAMRSQLKRRDRERDRERRQPRRRRRAPPTWRSVWISRRN